MARTTTKTNAHNSTKQVEQQDATDIQKKNYFFFSDFFNDFSKKW